MIITSPKHFTQQRRKLGQVTYIAANLESIEWSIPFPCIAPLFPQTNTFCERHERFASELFSAWYCNNLYKNIKAHKHKRSRIRTKAQNLFCYFLWEERLKACSTITLFLGFPVGVKRSALPCFNSLSCGSWIPLPPSFTTCLPKAHLLSAFGTVIFLLEHIKQIDL